MNSEHDDTDALTEAIRPLVERCHQGVSAVRGKDGGSYWTRQALTERRLKAHIEQKKERGLGLIAPGGSTVLAALLDLDDHDGSLGFDTVCEVAGRILDASQEQGLYGHPWRSAGGGGVHIYYVWRDEQDAHSVRQALQGVLAACGLADGTGGLQANAVEVFPRQSYVPEDGFGNHFILPLAGQSVPLEPLLGCEPMARSEAAGYQWQASEPVPYVEREALPASSTSDETDLAELESALSAIPNDGDGLDYDEWRDVVFGIHYVDPGPDGLELAQRFSARSAKHDPDFLEQRVWPYIRQERSNAITGRTVLAKAREYGWELPAGLVANDFEFTAEESAGGEDEEPGLPRGLERDQNGVIKSTLRNATLMVGHPPATGYEVALDTFLGQTMIAVADGRKQWRPLRDSDYTELRLRCERWGAKPIGRETMRDTVDWVAERHEFDSAIQWLDSEVPEWDGVERIEPFFASYFDVEDCAYTRACGRYLWTALAGRVLSPGVKADMIPVLIGEQGVGKSNGVKAIVPDAQFFFEVDLRNSDADLARQMRGKLLGELDELRGMSKRDMEHVKSFASRTHEQWVPKYREQAYTYPRRGVFIGTSNARQFLTDETGNRRFLPLTASDVDADAVARDRLQLWAEARDRYRSEGVAHGEAERLARQYHAEYTWEDPWDDSVSEWLQSESFERDGERIGDGPFTTEDVLRSALDIPPARQSNRDAARVGAVLRKLGYELRRRRWVDGVRSYRWMRADL